MGGYCEFEKGEQAHHAGIAVGMIFAKLLYIFLFFCVWV